MNLNTEQVRMLQEMLYKSFWLGKVNETKPYVKKHYAGFSVNKISVPLNLYQLALKSECSR